MIDLACAADPHVLDALIHAVYGDEIDGLAFHSGWGVDLAPMVTARLPDGRTAYRVMDLGDFLYDRFGVTVHREMVRLIELRDTFCV